MCYEYILFYSDIVILSFFLYKQFNLETSQHLTMQVINQLLLL